MTKGPHKTVASLFIIALALVLMVAQSAGAASDPRINEFSASTAGTDVEYVEIFGTPNTDYSAYTVLEIEGDTTDSGSVDEVISIGTTDANGFYLASLPANAIENGSVTLLLVSNFTGALNSDLDINNDGVLDLTPWDAIVDAVAVDDGGAGDLFYGVPVLGPNYDGISSFAPGGASRYPDGSDIDSATDWVRNDFDLAGIPGFTGTPVAGEALNTPGEMNELFTPEICGDPATAIHDVQGSGLTSPLVGTEVAIEGIVVGDFQNNAMPDNGDLNGFFVQEEDADADADPFTSEGIFVYAPGGLDVGVGDQVRVHGTVTEFNGLTELSGVTLLLQCSTGNALPTVTNVSLPVASVGDFEKYEGMAVTLPQTLYISEYFNFDRFNEIVLTTERQFQPTAIYEPGSPNAMNLALANSLSRITLDDGRNSENPDPAIHPNGNVFDLSNLFRGGDTLQNVTGVMDYEFGLYRIQSTQGADYANANPRSTQPDNVGGNLKVASLNLLNYFTTIDTGAAICGPAGNQLCRGADDATEFTRQRNKIIAALMAIDADIVGLIEIENYPGDIPTADLVSGLNDAMGAGTYNYIATGAIGSDAIRNAFVYKPATVSPVGSYAVLDSTVDPRFLDNYSRPTLAQTFQDNSTRGIFTVAVNHLKSKGSDCNAVGDPDTGDGSGNCNLTRKAAAEALVDWLAGDPTGSGDEDFLIIGDLNSYDKEDPIDSIKSGSDDILGTADDYSDLIFQFIGEYAYSYLFDGQLGYLDHALANTSMTNQVTAVTIWHINADEPDLIDYDTTFKQPNQDAIYAPDAYRSSDHDPVIIGLNLACDVNCVSICRSAGFWQTHAGIECPKKQPNCGSQNITQMVIDACGECLEICGEVVQNTAFNDADSAVEAMCIPVRSDIELQLARQLTALSLNCCISGFGSDCSGSPAWWFIFSGCNTACENQSTEGYQPCIDALDCLNSGRDLVSIEPVTCQPPLEDSCAFQPLCNETLDLCFNGKQEKIAGSTNACNRAIKSACGIVPIDESKGELACGSGTKEEDPEACCQPAIEVDKTGDELSKVGDDVTYHFKITNTSLGHCPDLLLDSVSDSVLGSLTAPASCDNLAPGGFCEFDVPYTLQAGDPDPLDNTVEVHYHPVGFSNDITASASHSLNLFQPSIAFVKSGDTLSKVGDDVNYTLTLYNNSSSDTPDLNCTISDPILNYINTVSVASGSVSTSNITYTVQAGDPDPLENTVSVTCSPAGFPNELTASASHSVNLFQPSVSITKTGPDFSKAGDTVTYNVTIENTSSADSPNLVLDSFSDSVVSGVTPPASCNNLAPGASCTFSCTYTLQAGDPDPFVNTATVHYHPDGSSNDITSSSSWTIDLVNPSFTVSKVCLVEPVPQAGPAVFTITFNNTGDADLHVVPSEGAPFDVGAGASYGYEYSIPGPFSGDVQNTVTGDVTLAPEYGLSNSYTFSASDSCTVEDGG